MINIFGGKAKDKNSSSKPNRSDRMPQKPDKSNPKPPTGENDGNGGKDNGDNTPSIKPGDCFFHKESRKLYQITGFEYGELTNGVQVPIVIYSGKDMHVRKQNIFLFLQNFQQTFVPKFNKSQMEKMEKTLHSKQVEGKDAEELPTSESDTSSDGESVPLGTLYTPTNRHTFDKMIVWPDAKEEIETAIRSIERRKEIQETWHLSEIEDEGNRSIINLYGPSGTGKTMLARCIARIVNKKLLQVNYAEIVDKYVGETGKHISQAFATAVEKDAILFFDEADSLCSKRVDMNVNADYANSVNQNRNILMQELDKFNDIVVMATNFFNNFDEALIRRINRHIEIKLPNAEMRVKLFKLHIPVLERAKEVDFEALAQETKEFSGGDIKNVCKNAMEAASTDEDISNWILKQEILSQQIQKIINAKESHKQSGSNSKRRSLIGFGTEPVIETD